MTLNFAELQNVTMAYGQITALQDISLTLHAGESVAVLGPNGAGKTTAIKLLTGQKRKQKGNVLLFGENPRSPSARRHIGVTPQEASFPHAQKVCEILRFAQSHFENPLPRQELLSAFGLSELGGRMANELSGGQQRKLAVALAFCGQPRAVFLDEPTTGIDTQSRKQLWAYIHAFKQAGGSIFLTTHYFEEAEFIADRIILLNKGKIARDGTTSEIKNAVNVRTISFHAPTLPILTSAKLSTAADDRYTFLSTDADSTIRELVTSSIPFQNLEVLPASLEAAISELLGEPS